MLNKKIGILTFHWATNYGAVLQAFALQEVLSQLGYDTYIINYKPSKYDNRFYKILKSKSYRSFNTKLIEFYKEKNIKKFRQKYLNLTNRYYSQLQLKKNPPKMDFYITGSDQVWNTYFTTKGEGNFTSVYYLNFGPPNIKRIGYAVSFGITRNDYPISLLKEVTPLLKEIDVISVRENSGADILNSLFNIESKLVCDPTLLLLGDFYVNRFRLARNKSNKSLDYIFSYILRKEQYKSLLSTIFDKTKIPIHKSVIESPEEWLNNIYNSSLIITNSYHGMVFSIIFKKQFIVVLEDGNAMNDRFITLLNYIGLENRIYYPNLKESSLDEKIDSSIEWDIVDEKIECFRKVSKAYLLNFLL